MFSPFSPLARGDGARRRPAGADPREESLDYRGRIGSSTDLDISDIFLTDILTARTGRGSRICPSGVTGGD